jgi:hypothetical protein
MITKIISGGQTGADQGGLIAALACGIETGGWACFGWKTESGSSPWLGRDYGLRQWPEGDYPDRTRANVAYSDGTLWFGKPESNGFYCTYNASKKYTRPFLIAGTIEGVYNWIKQNKIETLNIAGNRESHNHGICKQTEQFLRELFEYIKEHESN